MQMRLQKEWIGNYLRISSVALAINWPNSVSAFTVAVGFVQCVERETVFAVGISKVVSQLAPVLFGIETEAAGKSATRMFRIRPHANAVMRFNFIKRFSAIKPLGLIEIDFLAVLGSVIRAVVAYVHPTVTSIWYRAEHLAVIAWPSFANLALPFREGDGSGEIFQTTKDIYGKQWMKRSQIPVLPVD